MNKMILILIVLFGSKSQADERKFRTWDGVCAHASTVVTEGDLIFTAIPNIVFREVADATASWTSHVGIVLRDEKGDWSVFESAVPLARRVPLCSFLKRSTEFRFEIKRLDRPLSHSEIAQVKMTAENLLGSVYELGFDFDSRRMFCSKFVYLAYQTIGIEVGVIQTFQELLEANPNPSQKFWRWWFLGSIPWERRTVTPASQLNDSKFISVSKGD